MPVDVTKFQYSGFESSIALLGNVPTQPEVDEVFYDDFIKPSMRHLCDGSNSNVFVSQHKKFGKTVVIVKIIKKNPPDATNAWREFSLEHELLSRTKHPNVVGYLGGGNNPEKRPFLVLEKLDGGSLMNQLGANNNGSPYSYRRCLEIAKQFADALEYLHYNFHADVIVLHRDLKPDNVGFHDGVLKLMDFGLCACIPRIDTAEHPNHTYTMTGNTGSLRFMAPEVVRNQAYNEKVDIYSYGLIMWQVATGIQPFSTLSRAEFLPKVVQGNERPPVNLKRTNKCHLSPELVQIITSSWNPDFKVRSNARDMAKQLKGLLEAEMSKPEEVGGGGCACTIS